MRTLRVAVIAAFFSAAAHQIAFASTNDKICHVPPIMATHTFALYPVAAVRQREEGVMLMRVLLGPDGVPVSVTIKTSTGYSDLDEAASSWVKDNWRWQPPQDSCNTALVRYVWKIKDERTPAPATNLDPISKYLMENHY